MFCGLGGFSIAMHQIDPDAICVSASDIDPQARHTFKTNFGVEPQGDITTIDPDSIPDHDILFGGFPCQPFSRNGRHYNHHNQTVIGDTRANLFLNLVSILSVKQPKYFVFENVKGLLSMKNEDGTLYFETIVDNLQAVGYRVSTQVLDAARFAVPQQRQRVFFVGIRSDIDQRFGFPTGSDPRLGIRDILVSNVDSKYLLTNLWRRRLVTRNPNAVKSANHGFPAGTPRLQVLKSIYDSNVKPTDITGQIESVAILYGETPSGLPRQQDKIYSILGISPTIATFSTPAVAITDDPTTWRQLTPRECARLQAIPDSFILPKTDAVAYKQIGNAICVNVVKAILDSLMK